MISALALLVPAVLATASPGAPIASGGAQSDPQLAEEFQIPDRPGKGRRESHDALRVMAETFGIESRHQVRIERRVIVRISPRQPFQSEALADRAAEPALRRFRERRMGRCVPIRGIANIRITSQDLLLLMMRDSRMVSVRLEKSCSAKDFYSGFYVEDTSDGLICAGRDTLHSRAGVNCEVSRLHRLVPEKD